MSDEHALAVWLRADGSVAIDWSKVQRQAAMAVLNDAGVMAKALLFVRNQMRPEPTTRIMAVEFGTGIDEHAVRADERERIITYVDGLRSSRRVAADSHAAVGDSLFASVATGEARLCGSIIHAIREIGKPDDK